MAKLPKAQCLKCGKMRVRIFRGKRSLKYKLPMYENRYGKFWRGYTCPMCLRPHKTDLIAGVEFNPDPLTQRRCRICSEFLPASRYFRHSTCRSYPNTLNSVNWEDSWVEYDWGYEVHLGR